TDAVAVRVGERPRVHLVDRRLLPPPSPVLLHRPLPCVGPGSRSPPARHDGRDRAAPGSARVVGSTPMSPSPELAPSYSVARRRFLDAAGAAGAVVTSHPMPGNGPEGEDLSIDVARLGPGPGEAEKVVFVVSGTHGVEGFAGSECQHR